MIGRIGRIYDDFLCPVVTRTGRGRSASWDCDNPQESSPDSRSWGDVGKSGIESAPPPQGRGQFIIVSAYRIRIRIESNDTHPPIMGD